MLVERIDSFYGKQRGEKERRSFYVSEADSCPRQIYYAFKNKPRAEFEPQTKRILEQGTYTHMRLMSALFGMGVVKAVEIAIPPNELFSGRADAILALDNEPYILEIKSMKDYAFYKLTTPSFAMIKQVQMYMHYFHLEKSLIIVENKDTQELKEFIIKKDEAMINQLIHQFDYLQNQIGSSVVPQKPEDLEPWKCKLCPYQFCMYFTGKKLPAFEHLDQEGNSNNTE
ncbi:MAG: hypothetical protein AABW64_00900 [Nanoarchaeota archaeon]